MASSLLSIKESMAASGFRQAKSIVNALFDAIDSDNSGSISRVELISYCTGLMVGTYHNPMARALLADYGVTGEKGSMAALETMFAAIDADGDGHITHDEFVAGLMMNHHAAREKAAEESISEAHTRGIILGAVISIIGVAAAYTIISKIGIKST